MSTNWPTTVDEAVNLLVSTLSADEKDTFRTTPHSDLILHHFGLGQYIRNTFGLWQGNDDLLRSCHPEVTDPYLLEIIKQDPDGASTRIIDTLWRRLQS